MPVTEDMAWATDKTKQELQQVLLNLLKGNPDILNSVTQAASQEGGYAAEAVSILFEVYYTESYIVLKILFKNYFVMTTNFSIQTSLLSCPYLLLITDILWGLLSCSHQEVVMKVAGEIREAQRCLASLKKKIT